MTEPRAFSQAEFGDFVDDAALQRKFMSPWQEDRKLDKDGWKTFYAVDADIFRFYGNPRELARREHARRGYAEVFRHDDAEGSLALAYRLADHIFFRLTGDEPLLVVPPIDGEINRIMTALTLQLGREPVQAPPDVDRIRTSIKRLTDLSGDEHIPLDILASFSRLIRVRGTSGEQTVYLRLCQLLELRRISTVDALDGRSGRFGLLQDLVERTGSVKDIVDHSYRASKWRDRLRGGAAVGSRQARSAIYDAQALARLEGWNAALAAHRMRVLYITGSAHVIEAAERHDEGSRTFLDAYVRHPRYFLASPDVVAPSARAAAERPPAASEFFDWLITFLAEIDSNGGRQATSRKTIRSSAEAAFRKDGDLGRSLNERWGTHLATLAASYAPPQESTESLITSSATNEEKQGIELWSRMRAEIEQRIEAALDEAWDACFRSATQTGFFVGAMSATSSRKLPPARLVPPLRFDGWKSTDSFVRLMAQWREARDIDTKQYQAKLADVKAETGEDYFYAYYLAHAALFAARGNWRIGEVLAKRALTRSAVDGSYRDRAGHGREANFLAAHCRRYTARNERDLSEAELMLHAARSIYVRELAERPALKIVPERFETEGLSIALTRLLYSLFTPTGSPPAERISEIARSEEGYADLLRSFLALRRRLRDEVEGMRELDNASPILQVARDETLRIDTNILFLGILLRKVGETELDDVAAELQSGEGASFYRGRLLDAYRVMRHQDRRRLQKLQSDLSDENIRHYRVLPYDGQRYAFLRDIAAASLAR